MKYRYLGRSGLLVSRLCLGTMTFGNPEWGCDQQAAGAIVRRFVEGGGNFIDTADAAGDLDLPDDVRQRLTDAMPLKLGYPYEWMATNMPGTFGKAETDPQHAERLP